MLRKLGFASLSVAFLGFLFLGQTGSGQVASAVHSRALIPQNLGQSKWVTLRGNTRPEVNAENDRGAVADYLPMEHMLLQLRHPPEQEQALQQFIDDLHSMGSPNFHRWITAQEFGARFGSTQIDTVTAWLESQGFQVNVVYPNRMLIDFSGTAGQVRQAFHAEIHNLEVKGEKHIANVSDPQIPAELVPAVAGIVSLNDFRPQSMHRMRNPRPDFTFTSSTTTYAIVPADLATIYNLNPLFSAGYTGQGQTIALIEDTDVFSASDWSTFRSTFGLSKYTSGSFTTVHPAPSSGTNNCGAPGVIAPNDAEAILDAEWASAAAPNAPLEIASCADTTTTFGGLIAVQNLINSASPPPIMSISYGQCETENGASANAAYNSAYQQAVAEGVSVFVAAGDSGAAGCDNSVSEATHGIGANAFASTPYNVAVGGTDFSDTFSGTNSTYWSSTNSSTFGSAISYIPEIPWNDSCAGVLLSNFLGFSPTYGSTSLCNDSLIGSSFLTTVAGGGAPSACASGAPSVTGVVSGTCQGWPKPSWQSLVGNPTDGVRDTPDVSLFAADGLWSHYYIFCWSDTAHGGAACTGAPSGWSGAGGTSFASPIMAGIQALVNQKTGARQGNPNPAYYQLAASEYGSSGSSSCNSSNGNTVAGNCIFYDVTQGDMDVNCTGANNCYLPSGTEGVLSTSGSSYKPAYGTGVGWDFATGIGSVNAANLVNHWPTTTPNFTLSASPASLSITQGSTGTSTITVTPLNGFTGSVNLSASGLPSGVTAAFNPASTTGASTLTLTTSSTATTGTASVTITGTSGSLTNTTSLSLTVNATPVPNFSLSASPGSLTINQGTSGSSTITVTPQNGFTGSVSLSASGLPSGVTAAFNPASTTGTSTLTLTASGTATTGTVSVAITGTSGSLTNTTSVSLTVRAVTVVTLPSGWTDTDVGTTGLAGSASFANNVFTVKGAGAQVYSTADAFHFVYQPLSGDGTIVARVLSVQGGSGYVSAGVMIRETLTAGSTMVDTAEWASYSTIYFVARSTTGGSAVVPANVSAALPYWVKVTRSGNTFSSYTSSDGVNWVQLGTSQTITMAQNVSIGLAVDSGSTTALATATFDNVSVNSAAAPAPVITSVSATTGSIGNSVVISGTGFGATQGNSTVLLNGAPVTINSWSATSLGITIPTGATSGPLLVSVAPSMNDSNPVLFTVTSQPLPSGWLDQDVGSVGLTGSAGYSSGTFTVKGGGAQVYSTADAFHFVYQPLSGDGTIVARVVSVQGGSGYVSAGVMVRETLTPGSTMVDTAEWNSYHAIYFVARTTTGGSAVVPANVSAATPYWVKVTRSGSTFSSYTSSDGVNWVQLGTSQTISMAQNVSIGLAVDSGTTTALTTATFDNVAITHP